MHISKITRQLSQICTRNFPRSMWPWVIYNTWKAWVTNQHRSIYWFQPTYRPCFGSRKRTFYSRRYIIHYPRFISRFWWL